MRGFALFSSFFRIDRANLRYSEVLVNVFVLFSVFCSDMRQISTFQLRGCTLVRASYGGFMVGIYVVVGGELFEIEFKLGLVLTYDWD